MEDFLVGLSQKVIYWKNKDAGNIYF